MITRPGIDGHLRWTDFYESCHPEALGVRVVHGDIGRDVRPFIYVLNAVPMQVRKTDNRRGERIGKLFAAAFSLAHRLEEEAGWPEGGLWP